MSYGVTFGQSVKPCNDCLTLPSQSKPYSSNTIELAEIDNKPYRKILPESEILRVTERNIRSKI